MSRNLKNATEVEQVSSLSVANADSDLKSSSESGSTCSIMDVPSDSSSNSVRPTLVEHFLTIFYLQHDHDILHSRIGKWSREAKCKSECLPS